MISQHIWNQESDARAYWDVCGTFGQLNGTVDRAPGQISCQNGTVSIICQYEKTAYGLYSRRDTVTNISRKPIRLTGLKARFLLDEGEYRVYTQFNNWQRESQGSWQDLVTAVSAASRNIRSAQTATPFLSLWNRQLNRGAAFHLLPFCSWEIRATRIAAKSPTNRILVELGVGALSAAVDAAELLLRPQRPEQGDEVTGKAPQILVGRKIVKGIDVLHGVHAVAFAVDFYEHGVCGALPHPLCKKF